MNDRLLGTLGLCRRARRMVIGRDTVIAAIEDGSATLVLCAADFSDNSRKAVERAAGNRGVTFIRLDADMDALSCALGKTCGVLGVTDEGFAEKIRLLLDS